MQNEVKILITKRGLTIWALSALTFLSILASFAMAVMLVNQGPGTIVSPYVLSILAGALEVEIYLWLSIAFSVIFMALTCIFIFRKQPPNPELVKLLLKIGGNLAALRKTQESSVAEIADQIQYGRKVDQKFFSTVTSEIEEDKQELLEVLEKQEKAVKKVRSDTIAAIETKTTEAVEKVFSDLKKQETAILGIKNLNEDTATGLNSQRAELEEIKLKLEKIEENIAPNNPKLKSVDNPEDIKGIGPALGKELRSMGVTSVGELITTDPELIGEKTRVSKEMAENLQTSAQLMMVPGVSSTDAELLMDAGIKSRKDLASQDLIVLSRKVGDLAKIYADQGKISKEELPTIEKVSSWIRNAK
jgi:predicted flap endonuclease-1-like 5' DNA nuclease